MVCVCCAAFGSLTNHCSCKRSYRGSHDRPWDDRQPVSYRLDAILHRLRAVRASVQHHLEADYAEVLATNFDDCLGYRRDVDGRDAEFSRLLCRAILVGASDFGLQSTSDCAQPWCNRIWTIPRSCLLPEHVV